MAKATDDIQAAETIIKTIFTGREKEKALLICRWLFEFNSSSNGHTIKCYPTEVPDICFCVDRGGDCDKQRIQTWFFRIRLNLQYILRGYKGSVPYLQPVGGTKDSLIAPKNSQKLDDACLKEHIIESYEVLLERLDSKHSTRNTNSAFVNVKHGYKERAQLEYDDDIKI